VVPKYASVVIDQHHNMLIQLVDPTAQAVD
jgi:hypothetical protein